MMYTPGQSITTKMTKTTKRIESYHKIDLKNDNSNQVQEHYGSFEDETFSDELLKRIASNEKVVSRILHHHQQQQQRLKMSEAQPQSLSDLQQLQKQQKQHHQMDFDTNENSTLEDINKSSSIDGIHKRTNGITTNNNNDNALPVIFQQDTMGNIILSNDSSKTDITSNDKNYDQHQKARDHVHVMYGLSGDASGFIEEFTISLKSVLLNAPIFSNLTIHIIADNDAYNVLYNVINTTTTIQSWITYHQISVRIYNVESKIDQWKRYISKVMKLNVYRAIEVHTIGAFFRLSAYKVITQQYNNNDVYDQMIHHILYMDTDVIIMANLEKIWQYTRQDNMKDKLFLWGHGQCSGFVILNIVRMNTIWELASTINLISIGKEMNQKPNDQLIFRSINITYPNEVGILNNQWDVTIASIDHLWEHHNLLKVRSNGIGMLHFNGGAISKKNAFITSDFLIKKQFYNTWGNANYYVNMPWEWVQFIIESYNIHDYNNNYNNNDRENNQNKGFPITIYQYVTP